MVLYVLWQTNKPLKAYDILEILLDEQPNATAATVYRTLSFFVTEGVVHKVDALQAYSLCSKPDLQGCSEVLMVCAMCRDVREVQDASVRKAMLRLAQSGGFALSHAPIELRGVCADCTD